MFDDYAACPDWERHCGAYPITSDAAQKFPRTFTFQRTYAQINAAEADPMELAIHAAISTDSPSRAEAFRTAVWDTFASYCTCERENWCVAHERYAEYLQLAARLADEWNNYTRCAQWAERPSGYMSQREARVWRDQSRRDIETILADMRAIEAVPA
jgi:hypothetical protein